MTCLSPTNYLKAWTLSLQIHCPLASKHVTENILTSLFSDRRNWVHKIYRVVYPLGMHTKIPGLMAAWRLLDIKYDKLNSDHQSDPSLFSPDTTCMPYEINRTNISTKKNSVNWKKSINLRFNFFNFFSVQCQIWGMSRNQAWNSSSI